MKPLYKEKYPHLFEPLIVGKNKVEYKNRIFQAPMGMALGTDANGLINDILMGIGIIDSPIQMLQTDFAVYVGITYCYLPYMVLPLFSALMKVDLPLLASPTIIRRKISFLTLSTSFCNCFNGVSKVVAE